MLPYTMRVIDLIKGIPKGYVMTYGQIAKLAGNSRGARQVVRILHTQSKAYELPWHRVVNAKGQISIMDEEMNFLQKLYLQEEGIVWDEQDRIQLESYRYIPE